MYTKFMVLGESNTISEHSMLFLFWRVGLGILGSFIVKIENTWNTIKL